VWRLDQNHDHGVAGADVLDLSCPNAQRLFPTDKTKEPRIYADEDGQKIRKRNTYQCKE